MCTQEKNLLQLYFNSLPTTLFPESESLAFAKIHIYEKYQLIFDNNCSHMNGLLDTCVK